MGSSLDTHLMLSFFGGITCSHVTFRRRHKFYRRIPRIEKRLQCSDLLGKRLIDEDNSKWIDNYQRSFEEPDVWHMETHYPRFVFYTVYVDSTQNMLYVRMIFGTQIVLITIERCVLCYRYSKPEDTYKYIYLPDLSR